MDAIVERTDAVSLDENQEENTDINLEEEIQEQEEPVPEPSLDFRVDSDKMSAYLSIEIFDESQTVSFDEAMAFLKSKKIVYGLLEDDIRAYCEKKDFSHEICCARGLPPVDGKDGYIEYRFNKEVSAKPKIKDDGRIDYFNLDLIQNIEKDQILCEMFPPEKGTDGFDVLNNLIPHKQGLKPRFLSGTNTYVSEDGKYLKAKLEGCVEFKNSRVNVSELFTTSGDVDVSTGNINFYGSVVVKGDVRSGFSIKAGKDVTVQGMVEGAVIEAKGSITIRNGMIGMNIGKLTAGEHVKCKYVENAAIISKKNVYAEVFLNADVNAGDSIIAASGKGVIMGGRLHAGKVIYAKKIGTESYKLTSVMLGGDPLEFLEEKPDDDQPKKTPKLEDLMACKVIALQTLYPGVKISIGSLNFVADNEYQNVKFHLEADGIEPTVVNPGDRIV